MINSIASCLAIYERKKPLYKQWLHQLNKSKYYLFTIKACITPGNQPMMVSITLIKNVVPSPCFKKTANGGKNIFKSIVSIDIIMFFLFPQN